MQERQKVIVTGLVVLLAVLTLGFFTHRDPRFAGSLMGGVLGVSAAALMLVPLAYLIVKRVPWLKRRVTPRVSMRSLLSVHIYSGVLAPILAILHTGHKFQSPLGIALTLMMLIVVFSGYVGRYLLGQLSTDLRTKRADLARLRQAYDLLPNEIAADPSAQAILRAQSTLGGRIASFFLTRGSPATATPANRALRLAESISDLELAIRTHATAKDLFRRWLVSHIIIAIILYLLLFIHIWSAWYFGIRWLP